MKTSKLHRPQQIVVLILYTTLCLATPLLFAWVGSRSPGIDLAYALYAPATWESLKQLLIGSGIQEQGFRNSMLLGVWYATVVALLSTSLAFSYAVWTAHWSQKKGVGMAFTLLTLVLLPQTYLVMSGLLVVQELPVRPSDQGVIISFLLIGTLPVVSWGLYLLAANRIRNLHFLCAADGTSMKKCLLRTLYHIRVEIVVVFVLAWAITWGNFLVPYSFGTRHSFPAVVQIATFTTNLGRDWSMIGAAGFLVALPGILAGCLIGFWIMSRVSFGGRKR